jgi:hypothetical protein
VRLIRRKASSARAKGADCTGQRYYAQLILEGKPFLKPKNCPGQDILGLDLGPSTLAVVPRQGLPRLLPLAEEVHLDARKRRRLQRKLDRQRRANNPQNYDEQVASNVRASNACVGMTARGTRKRGDNRTPQTHSCEHWRHSLGSLALPHQTVAVLPWLSNLSQETVVPALAEVGLRGGTGAT